MSSLLLAECRCRLEVRVSRLVCSGGPLCEPGRSVVSGAALLDPLRSSGEVLAVCGVDEALGCAPQVSVRPAEHRWGRRSETHMKDDVT